MKAKNYIFFFKRLLTDLKENQNLKIVPSHDPELKEYYIPFNSEGINTRGGNKPFHFDQNGIPLVHTYINVKENKGYYYYPITIGQYGLALYHDFLINGEKKQFLNIAEWFVQNAEADDTGSVFWKTSMPRPEYGLNAPWKSAFAQSRGISNLLRAWQLTGDDRYFAICKQALLPFAKDISEGGVTSNAMRNIAFYEEYVSDKPIRVLDGHFFALFGIYDYIRATQTQTDDPSSKLAKDLFHNGIISLKHWLPKFEIPGWLLFVKPDHENFSKQDPCTIGYLRLICSQLDIIAFLSDDRYFSEKASNFRRLINGPNIIKMWITKINALKDQGKI